MNQKLFVVLFSTILFYGVTYSSTIKEQLGTEKSVTPLSLPLVAGENTPTRESIKLENTVVPTTNNHSVSNKQDATSGLENSEISTTHKPVRKTMKTTISTPIIKNITGNSSTEVVKNENPDSVILNKNTVADNKNFSQTVENKNETLSDASSSTNTPLITTNAIFTTAKTVKTTIKPTVSTIAPTPTLANKVVTEENTPAPAEGNHFNGPSFFGGIVLTTGLIAIGFIAFKYYKSGKIDMNYRTL